MMIHLPRRTTLRSYAKSNAKVSLEQPHQIRGSSCLKSTVASELRDVKDTKVVCHSSVDINVAQEPSERDSEIVGREKERLSLRQFVHSAIAHQKSSTLYVSGAPGTGKTAVVVHEIRSFAKEPKCLISIINCMHLRSASELFPRLIHSLKPANSGGRTATSFDVEGLLNRLVRNKTLILILDEVDQLATHSQDILYRIFSWPEELKCHIIIIGIANALDLPERLPKLQSKSYQPVHMIFAPYTRAELTDIINAKLNSRGETCGACGLDPLAVQLCARKISASTGDVRTALDICQRAISFASQEARRQNMAADKEIAVQPSLRHISMALKEANGCHRLHCITGNSTANVDDFHRSENLPLHHKLIIAACHLLRCQCKKQRVSFTELYDVYNTICLDRQLKGLEESEIVTICGLLDSRGCIEFSSTKEGANCKSATPARFRYVKLRLDGHTVAQLLSDEMFSNILRISLVDRKEN